LQKLYFCSRISNFPIETYRKKDLSSQNPSMYQLSMIYVYMEQGCEKTLDKGKDS
jgi:hypothetical protein